MSANNSGRKNQSPLDQLLQQMADGYDLDEIRSLCLTLNINFDELPYPGLTPKIRELIRLTAGNNQLPRLLETVSKERPQLVLPKLEDLLTAVDEELPYSPGIKEIEQLPPESGNSPYKGLEYFHEEDADWFFGREAATAVLVERLHDVNFLAVVGASGSGKSSLVRAGVIPVVKRKKAPAKGTIPPRGKWKVYIITPTAHPLDKLVETLFPDDVSQQDEVVEAILAGSDGLKTKLVENPQPKGQKTLLVLDQFEELFTQCKKEPERSVFIDNLLSAAQEEWKIIITLRADFYSHCLHYEGLRQVLKKAQEPIGAMSRSELHDAIVLPAKKGNWPLQAGLVEEMLADVGQEPGALPLLSHALRETWQHRHGRTLTLSSYQTAGGVRGAIAHSAEKVFTSLSKEAQAIAHKIFVQLTELGEEGTQDTRRRVPRQMLAENEQTQNVIHALAKARLITTTKENVEVAHEALIREWPRLREWVDADRQGEIIYRRLANASQEWQENGRDSGFLYRGFRLTEAELWVVNLETTLTETESAFLEASIAERSKQKAEAEEKRRIAEELRLQQQIKRVMQASKLAYASQLALVTNSELALLLATTALGISEQEETREVFIKAMLTPFRGTLYGHKRGVNSAVFSPDGQRILTASFDGTAKLWDLAGQEVASLEGHESNVSSAVFSPDGQRILTASSDGTAKLWDLDGQELASLEGHGGGVRSAWFSPDGQRVLTASDDGTAKVWDLDGQELVSLESHTEWVRSAVFSPDGQRILTASFDSTAKLWDLDGQELVSLVGHRGDVNGAVFSPDGQCILTRGIDRTAKVWDMTGQEIASLGENEKYAFYSANFNPNGKRILTGNSDGTARVWDVAGEELVSLVGHKDGVIFAVVSPDGWHILTASADGTAKLWDFDGQERVSLEGHKDIVKSAVFSSDGQRILTASRDGTAKLWDVAQELAPLIYVEGDLGGGWISSELSLDGQRILAANDDSTAKELASNGILESAVAVARQRLHRGFTGEECARFFRDAPESCPRTVEAVFALFDDQMEES